MYSRRDRRLRIESWPDNAFVRFKKHNFSTPATYNKYRRRVMYASELWHESSIPEKQGPNKRTNHPQNSSETDFDIPGLEKVLHSSRYWQKFVWLCAVFAFYGLCVYQLTDRITLYFEGPISLDVRVKKVASIEFPSVTVCPPYERDIFNLLIRKLSGNNNNIVFQFPYEFVDLNVTLQDVWNTFALDREIFISHESSCSHQDSHKRNTFDGDKGKRKKKSFANMNQPCERIDMTDVNDQTMWGICIRLTPETHLDYRGAWTYFELKARRVFWNVNFNIPILKNLEHDVVFVAHSGLVRPTHELAKQFYRVRRGTEVTVSFSVKQYSYVNTKKNPCVDLKISNNCKEQCLKDRLNTTVRCSLPFMEGVSLQPCSSIESGYGALVDVQKVYREFDGCGCPRPCNETIINYISDYHSAQTNESAVFKISFPDNAVEIITENFSYGFSSLLSDIGGNLGFCVGISLFSFVEIGVSTLQLFSSRLWEHSKRH